MLFFTVFVLGIVSVHAALEVCVDETTPLLSATAQSDKFGPYHMPRAEMDESETDPVPIPEINDSGTNTKPSAKIFESGKEYEVLLLASKPLMCKSIRVDYSTKDMWSNYYRWLLIDGVQSPNHVINIAGLNEIGDQVNGLSIYSLKWNFYDQRWNNPSFKELKIIFKCVGDRYDDWYVIGETPMVKINHHGGPKEEKRAELKRVVITEDSTIKLDKCQKTAKRSKNLEVQLDGGTLTWELDTGESQMALIAYDRSMNSHVKNAAKYFRKWSVRVVSVPAVPFNVLLLGAQILFYELFLR